MRELTKSEVKQVAGGLLNIVGYVGAVQLAWAIGIGTGNAINSYNSSQGRSFGRSLFKATH